MTTPAAPSVRAAIDAITDHLAQPADTAELGPAQSLADGPAGVALLHIERALAGTGPWDTAHHWLAAAVRDGVDTTAASSLYRGAPAIAFALHIASADDTTRYVAARRGVDRAVIALTHRRVDQALARIARAEPPSMAEYDLIAGLTGIGAHLLRHQPHDDALHRVLAYLVRLTEPLHRDGTALPGWWTDHDPHGTASPEFPGGHANLGLAHGITGPLALLSLATRNGIVVDRHVEAIERICAWLDTWRQHDASGTWWPQWITHTDRRAGRPSQPGPGRPSWCYGTPGLARAQQLAALTTANNPRQHDAEAALAATLADPGQLHRIRDPSLCHGWAGLLLTSWRTANDAANPAIANHLPHLIGKLTRHTTTTAINGDGLLDGRTGTALALHAAAEGSPPTSGWDACLLII